MGRLHNPRLVVHMSPDKAGQAVQIKPPLTPLSLIMMWMACIISVWVSVSHSVVRTAN